MKVGLRLFASKYHTNLVHIQKNHDNTQTTTKLFMFKKSHEIFHQLFLSESFEILIKFIRDQTKLILCFNFQSFNEISPIFFSFQVLSRIVQFIAASKSERKTCPREKCRQCTLIMIIWLNFWLWAIQALEKLVFSINIRMAFSTLASFPPLELIFVKSDW